MASPPRCLGNRAREVPEVVAEAEVDGTASELAASLRWVTSDDKCVEPRE
jgi:hypothetical protein